MDMPQFVRSVIAAVQRMLVRWCFPTGRISIEAIIQAVPPEEQPRIAALSPEEQAKLVAFVEAEIASHATHRRT